MGVEELSNGGGDDPRGLGSLGRVLGALVLVAVVVLLLPGRHPKALAPDVAGPPVPVIAFTAGLPDDQAITAPLDPGRYLTVGKTCSTVATDGTSLAVSFELVNFGLTDLTVISVKPSSPLHGLQPVGTTTAGGDCHQPGDQAVGGLLFSGDRTLFTLRFRVPKSCPRAHSAHAVPVPVTVALRVHQMVGTTTAEVVSSPGSITFDSCPASVTAAS